METRKRSRKTPFLLKAFLALFLAGLLFVVYRMITMDTTLSFEEIYVLPEFSKIDVQEPYYGQLAVAVNGKVIDSHDKTENGEALEGSSMTSMPRPIASTAKIITALMIMEEKPFEYGEKGAEIEISADDKARYDWYVANNGSTTAVKIGEKISEYDALSAMLLASSNNMADSLAIWAFSSMEAYLDYANQKLAEWGLNDTKVADDASGYHERTVSTANDLAILGQKVLKNPVLAEIVGLKSYTLPVAGTIENSNKLLGVSRISGIKTGYNGDQSGYCLLSGYLQDGGIITISLLGAPTRQQSFDDSLSVVEYLQTNLVSTDLVHDGEVVGKYDAWWIPEQKVTTRGDLSVLAWEDAENNFTMQMDGEKGELRFIINGDNLTIDIAAEKFDLQPNLLQRFLHVFSWEI